MEAIRKGDNFSNIIGLGTLGLGVHDSIKTKRAAFKEREMNKELMIMQLESIRRTDPEEYRWYINQPYIKKQLENYDIPIDTELLKPKGIR